MRPDDSGASCFDEPELAQTRLAHVEAVFAEFKKSESTRFLRQAGEVDMSSAAHLSKKWAMRIADSTMLYRVALDLLQPRVLYKHHWYRHGSSSSV